MTNPFVYGSRVTDEDFVGRDDELAVLENELRSGINIALCSRRHTGKTSLLHELARRSPEGLVFAIIDLHGVTSVDVLLKQLVSKSVAACLGKVEGFAVFAWELLRSTRLRTTVNADGELIVEFGRGGPAQGELEDALDLPNRLAASERKHLVVVFDDFDEAYAFGGDALMKTMRSQFQHHRSVSYVFSGSGTSLLRKIFEEPKGAFYKTAMVVDLGPIDTEPFARFVEQKFRSGGGMISEDLARALVERTGGHPFHTQHLAYELWNISRSPSGKEDLDLAVSRTLEHQSLAHHHTWESIRSPIHRRLLTALASEPEAKMGVGFIDKHGLVSRSHVQRAEKALVERGLIEKGRIVDPMFCEWLNGNGPVQR